MDERSNNNEGADNAPVETIAVARRSILKSALALGVSSVALNACLGGGDDDSTPATTVAFSHGVASGDPLSDRVILWTRATPSKDGDLSVYWEISASSTMANPVTGGFVTTNADRDYTVKVDATGLQANTVYYYRFRYGTTYSDTGRTRTLPAAGASVSQVRFALMSCSNWPKGYFNVYAALANLAGTASEPDILLHVGDYIYEYSRDGYSTTANSDPRTNDVRSATLAPDAELLTVDQYRIRHALYKTDPDSQAMHRLYPLIAVWDDHETANDSYSEGAENHQASEGSFTARRAAAVRAYFEWLPIRGDLPSLSATTPPSIYRSFDFGTLAKLMMLDTRLLARDEQLSTTEFVGVYTGTNLVQATPSISGAVTQTAGVVTTESIASAAETAVAGKVRTLLGTTQEDWVRAQVQASVAAGQTWQIFGQQILFHYISSPEFTTTESGVTATQQSIITAFLDGQFGTGSGALFATLGENGLPSPDGADSWIGYPTARRRFYDILALANNPVILSGDSHNAWAANLRSPSTGAAIGVEVAGTSVSSPGLEEYLALPSPYTLDPNIVSHIFTREDYGTYQFANTINANATLATFVDDLIYADTSQRGVVLVTVTPTATWAQYLFVNTVFTRSSALNSAATKTLRVLAGAKAFA